MAAVDSESYRAFVIQLSELAHDQAAEWLEEKHDALESSNALIEEQRIPLAADDSVTKQVQADYARMQHPVFDALSHLLESTVPEDAGFEKFRGGWLPEADDAKKNE